ncbi:hypothetical protein [Microvirga yunnanensis]|uniref:hypothetical protein n=1 Tax=Microvirga yunnanensis TaxID=2953740 RepID=UPI0021C97EAF|nr:hypothetical protein [Microvirga sp. HBU65207]
MPIYWKKTADVYPDSAWRHDNAFTAFDPDVRFPRFHMETGDETIGNIHLIEGGPQSGHWEWSMTVALSCPRYGRPTSGVEPSRGEAGRHAVEVYRHYLSTRSEQYPRARASRQSRGE